MYRSMGETVQTIHPHSSKMSKQDDAQDDSPLTLERDTANEFTTTSSFATPSPPPKISLKIILPDSHSVDEHYGGYSSAIEAMQQHRHKGDAIEALFAASTPVLRRVRSHTNLAQANIESKPDDIGTNYEIQQNEPTVGFTSNSIVKTNGSQGTHDEISLRLHDAAASGDIKTLRSQLEQLQRQMNDNFYNIQPNKLDNSHLSLKSIVDSQDDNGFTPLILAAAMDQEDLACASMKILLELGNANTQFRDHDGFTALHWAAACGASARVRLLIQHGANVNCLSTKLETPLHRACRLGRVEAIDELLSHGADPMKRNDENLLPIDVAGTFNNEISHARRRSACEVLYARKPSLKTLVLHHQDCLGHRSAREHQEDAQRLSFIMSRLLSSFVAAEGLSVITENDKLSEISKLYAPEGHGVPIAGFTANKRSKWVQLAGTHVIWPNRWTKTPISGIESSAIEISDSFAQANENDVRRAHSRRYYDMVKSLHKHVNMNGRTLPFTPIVQRAVQHVSLNELKAPSHCDTFFSPGTLPAALRAAGAVCHGIDRVIRGENRHCFCIVRPPGHHAGTSGLLNDDQSHSSCGFCVFNSVMIGALHALVKYKSQVKRVAIVDIDVHHGNGTEDIIKRLYGEMRQQTGTSVLDSSMSNSPLFFFSSHLWDEFHTCGTSEKHTEPNSTSLQDINNDACQPPKSEPPNTTHDSSTTQQSNVSVSNTKGSTLDDTSIIVTRKRRRRAKSFGSEYEADHAGINSILKQNVSPVVHSSPMKPTQESVTNRKVDFDNTNIDTRIPMDPNNKTQKVTVKLNGEYVWSRNVSHTRFVQSESNKEVAKNMTDTAKNVKDVMDTTDTQETAMNKTDTLGTTQDKTDTQETIKNGSDIPGTTDTHNARDIQRNIMENIKNTDHDRTNMNEPISNVPNKSNDMATTTTNLNGTCTVSSFPQSTDNTPQSSCHTDETPMSRSDTNDNQETSRGHSKTNLEQEANASKSKVPHSYRFYPGTGIQDDMPNNIINCPITPLWRRNRVEQPCSCRHATNSSANRDEMKRNMGRRGIRQCIDEKLIPALRAYAPDLILISAGFDGGRGDAGSVSSDGKATVGLDLTPEDFAWITSRILDVARYSCPTRVVSVLEGGYGEWTFLSRSGSGTHNACGDNDTRSPGDTASESSSGTPFKPMNQFQHAGHRYLHEASKAHSASCQESPDGSESIQSPNVYLKRNTLAENAMRHLQALVLDGFRTKK